MRKKYITILFCLTLINSMSAQSTLIDPDTNPNVLPDNKYLGNDWILDFSDEFNDGVIDLKKWEIDNSQKTRSPRPDLGIDEWYFKPQNIDEKDGNFIVNITKQADNIMYCGGIHGGKLYQFQYGYAEARIKIADSSMGTHTAFWMQGPGQKIVDGTCNDGAEIDIVESSELDDRSHFTLYWDGYAPSPDARIKGLRYWAPDLHDGEYHTFGFFWTENVMRVYYDGEYLRDYPNNQNVVQFTELQHIVRAPEYLWLSCGCTNNKHDGQWQIIKQNWAEAAVGSLLTQAKFDYVRVWKRKPTNNLVKNGDFQEMHFTQGTSYWTADAGVQFDTKYDGNPNDGNAINSPSVRFTGNAADYPLSIYQDIAVVPNRKYKFSFTARIANGAGASGTKPVVEAKFKGQIFKGESTEEEDKIFELITSSNENETLTGEFIVPDGVEKIRLRLMKEGYVAYLDDVELVEIFDATPSIEISKEKILTIKNISSSSKLSIVDPEGNVTDYPDGTNEASYDLNGKKIGSFSLKFTGDFSKTIYLNTSKK